MSQALAGLHVGIATQDDGRWLVSFATMDLGFIDPAGHAARADDVVLREHEPMYPVQNRTHVPGCTACAQLELCFFSCVQKELWGWKQ